MRQSSRARRANVTYAHSRNANIMYTQRVQLHYSMAHNGFFENIKKNIQEEQDRDAKLQQARAKSQAEAQKISEKYNPAMEKAAHIKEQTMSDVDKKFRAAREKIHESDLFNKASETMGSAARKTGLKFKVKVPGNIDPREWENVKETAAIAEALGQGIFGVLDIDPAYKRPVNGPRKRHPEWIADNIVANEDDTGVDLHADSRFKQTIDRLKDNRVTQKMQDLKERVEHSDSTLARGAMMFMWKIKEGLQMNAETGYTVEVIQRMELGWTQSAFCETLTDDFLPNILEAACLGDEEIVQDWCTEKVAGALLGNKKQAAQQGLSFQRHVYSLSNVEFMDASMDDETEMPTIMVSFQTQEKVALINAEGELVDGSITKPMSQTTIMVFARDMEERNPRAAWRVIEIQSEAKPMSF